MKSYISQDSVIIAADGGAEHVSQLGLIPDLLIGDLDSLTPERTSQLLEAGVEQITAPRDKDESDLEMALRVAAERYQQPIYIFGGIGGRIDQSLSNIMLLSLDSLANHEVYLVEPHQKAWIFKEEVLIEGQPGDLVSLIPLWGDVHIKSTIGLRWELADAWLAPGPSLGISNELVGRSANVHLSQGMLLCVHTDRNWRR